MPKEYAALVHALSSIFLMGDFVAQHERAKQFVGMLDNGFISFLTVVKVQKPTLAIKFIFKILGAIATCSFLGILLLGVLGIQSSSLVFFFSIAFLVSAIPSGSLYWVLHYKEVAKYFLRALLLFGGGSVLMPLMDVLADSNMTHLFSTMLSSSLFPFIGYIPEANLISEAVFVTSVYSGIVLFFYVTSWAYAGVSAIVLYSLLAMPIYAARVINKAFPKQPIAAIFIALWLVSFWFLTFG